MLTLGVPSGFTGTLWAACWAVRLGAMIDAGSPGERGAVLVADPLHLLAGVHRHAFRLQLPIPSGVPLRCEVWPQGCQGVASAWTLASTEGTASIAQCSGIHLGLPLVLPTGTGPAQPPSPAVGPKWHTGRGLDPILAAGHCCPSFGLLLKGGWPAPAHSVLPFIGLTEVMQKSVPHSPQACAYWLHKTRILTITEILVCDQCQQTQRESSAEAGG